MKLVKSLAIATIMASVASAQQEPKQADWAKHVQAAQARSRNRAYVDSGALDERKDTVHGRVSNKVGEAEHRNLAGERGFSTTPDARPGWQNEAEDDGHRNLQYIVGGSQQVDGTLFRGFHSMRENVVMMKKRAYSGGMWLIGSAIYRDLPHVMDGQEGGNDAATIQGQETAATPGQRALYSSPKFDERQETYQDRADAHVNNAKNRADMSKERAKDSGWLPTQEGQEVPAEGEQEKDVEAKEGQAAAGPEARKLYSSPKFDERKDTYQARAEAHTNNAKNRAEMSKDRAKESGWYPTQEGEQAPAEGEDAPAEQVKEVQAGEAAPADAEAPATTTGEAANLDQARRLSGIDITDPTTKMTYAGKGVAYAASGVEHAAYRGVKVAERGADFVGSRAELAYKDRQDNMGRKLEADGATGGEAANLGEASTMSGIDITDPTTKMTYAGKGVAYAASGVEHAASRGVKVAERGADFVGSRAELAYKNRQDNMGRKLRGRSSS